VAYFHGYDNTNEFYYYTGPDNDISSLPTFRVDFPMKGNVSVGDPTKLSFQVVTIDFSAKNMTVREYFLNTLTWGASKTIVLALRTYIWSRLTGNTPSSLDISPFYRSCHSCHASFANM
jgi:hypothetical protein